MRLQTKDAVAALDKLEKKIRHIENTINKVSNNEDKLTKNINKATTAQNSLTNATKQHEKAVDAVNNKQQKQNSLLDGAIGKVKRLASAYLGVLGARALIQTSDTITGAENKLNYINGGDTQATQDSMDKMYASAQKVRMGYTDMMANVSKSMVLAGDAFGGNIDNAIRFQEIMSEAYTIGGASAAEQASSMYQMIQALGSGRLQGDELRSVMEGAPLAYNAIEEFAQGVYNTTDSLKDMGSQGLITSDLIVAAMMNAGDNIDNVFKDTSMTFTQMWIMFKNNVVNAFRPVFESLKKLANSEEMQQALQIITNGLLIVAEVLQVVVNAFSAFFKWFVNNWYWIRFIVYAVVAALLVAFGVLAAKAIWTGIKMLISFLTSLSPLYLWIIMIGAVVAAIVWLANTTASACDFIYWALMIVAAGIALIGVITGSTALLIVAIVIAALAIVLYAFMECGEQIMGGIYVAGAIIYNIIAGLFNAIIQAGYSMFVEPMAGIIEWFVNAFNGGFNGIMGAAANAIGQIVSTFLSGLKAITKAIDAVAGTNFTGKISSWQNSAKSWGKNSNAVSYKVEVPTMKPINYGDAYDAGAKVGSTISNKLNSWVTTAKDWIGGLGSGDGLNNLLGGDLDRFSADNLNTTLNPDDIANALGKGGNDGNGKTLKDIADDTSDISDSLALSADDLEYLRKIASMEWKKEFTTANITVDMTNHNTVNGDSDLDGIVTRLTDKLYEELDSVANGVYA